MDESRLLSHIFGRHAEGILRDWMHEQLSNKNLRKGTLAEGELKEQCREFLVLLRDATADGVLGDTRGAKWTKVRELLSAISRVRSQQGFTPSETATFVFSMKQPLFLRIREEVKGSQEELFREIWTASALLDELGLWTTEAYQKAREEVIHRQQEDMLELSTPVVKLWDGVLALPMIGTLDSGRTQVVMESLLQKIMETEADVAIIDITGVPTVDTLVAQHLMKTVTAARLMGAECIISGIRPQIAQTIVHLEVDLGRVVTKASLADAFAIALKHRGLRITAAAATTH